MKALDIICVVAITFVLQSSGKKWDSDHDFIAGTFILTQKSLNEAPYRYAGVLRHVLDKVEQKDPPSQYDEENCSAKFRILPSGKYFVLSKVLIINIISCLAFRT